MSVTGPKLTTYRTNEEFRFKSGSGLLAEPDPDQQTRLIWIQSEYERQAFFYKFLIFYSKISCKIFSIWTWIRDSKLELP
jgi:hypothetical protein